MDQNEKISWGDNTELILTGGVQLDTNGNLDWKKPDNLDIGGITLNGGSFTIGDTSAQTFELDSDILLQVVFCFFKKLSTKIFIK